MGTGFESSSYRGTCMSLLATSGIYPVQGISRKWSGIVTLVQFQSIIPVLFPTPTRACVKHLVQCPVPNKNRPYFKFEVWYCHSPRRLQFPLRKMTKYPIFSSEMTEAKYGSTVFSSSLPARRHRRCPYTCFTERFELRRTGVIRN